MLEDETDLAIADAPPGDVLLVKADRAAAAVGLLQAGDDPEQRRLAGAGRSEQGHEFAALDREAHIVECGEIAERFADVEDFDAHGNGFCRSRLMSGNLFARFSRSPARQAGPASISDVHLRFNGFMTSDFPFQNGFQNQRDDRQARQERSQGKRGGGIVLIVINLDLQGHGDGFPAKMAGDDRNRAEFAHCAGVAEDHAVEQSPLDVRQGDAPKYLPAAGAQRTGGLLLFVPLRLHERDQLPRHERKGDEKRGEHDAGHREDQMNVISVENRADPALASE